MLKRVETVDSVLIRTAFSCSGGGARSVPQPAKASGQGLQGWATIHFVQENLSPRYAPVFSS